MKDFKDIIKGTLYIILGTVLLLHTLDIMKESLNYILIAASLIMILYGFLKSGFLEKIMQFIQRTTQRITEKKKDAPERS